MINNKMIEVVKKIIMTFSEVMMLMHKKNTFMIIDK